MNSTQSKDYPSTIETVEKYKSFVISNRIKRPESNKAKRIHFVNWFLNEHQEKTLDKNIERLSKYFLFISSRTIEDLLFKNETTH